ncbi:lysozyme inhibitor LprI family protein [Sphingomonas cannabina]|uniref:lysozyme inhibitor LprI family protein n=1 Tax=Sphingomonas cannabina TaxID=2899123 RepID=UPI001F1FADE2|nr:lysozyme inhibitor LprI family protein [Sphingomonas cannabina]UIJ44182.1 lysozyme inhibitor LprI family protein [Sphingomonas cannabina]
MKIFVTAAALATCALLLPMNSARADDLYDKCVNAASDNASWSQCGSDYVKREDAKLNAAWKQVYGRTNGQTKTDLLAEQRAWIAFREAACKFYANGDFGREGQVLSYPACVARVISDRTNALVELGKEFSQGR